MTFASAVVGGGVGIAYEPEPEPEPGAPTGLVLDSFSRTVGKAIQPNLGLSDSGNTWQFFGGDSTGASMQNGYVRFYGPANGGEGSGVTFDLRLGTFGSDNLPDAVSPSLETRFRFSYLHTVANDYTDIEFDLACNYPLAMEFHINSVPGGSGVGGGYIGVNGDTVEKTDWVANEWYIARVDVMADGKVGLKVYRESAGEGAYAIVGGYIDWPPGGTGSTGPAELALNIAIDALESGSGDDLWDQTVDFDYIQYVTAAVEQDPFDRSEVGGWGTGPLGTWTFPEGNGSHEAWFSADGNYGVVDQNADTAAGDLHVALAYPFGPLPVEVLFQWEQTFVPASDFYDNVFALGAGPGFDVADWAGIEIYSTGPSDPWAMYLDATYDPGLTYVDNNNALAVREGVALLLRFRIDEEGSMFARLWYVDETEPSTWQAEWSGGQTPYSWQPTHLFLEPRQGTYPGGPDVTGQEFRLDAVTIIEAVSPVPPPPPPPPPSTPPIGTEVPATAGALAAAVAAATSGDTLILRGGTHMLAGQITTAKYLTIVAYPGDTPNITWGPSTRNNGLYFTGSAGPIVVDGLTFTASIAITHDSNGSAQLEADGCDNLTIRNCTFIGNASLDHRQQLVYQRYGTNIHVTDCTFIANGSDGFGFHQYPAAGNPGCLVEDSTFTGFAVSGGVTSDSVIEVRNCGFYDNNIGVQLRNDADGSVITNNYGTGNTDPLDNQVTGVTESGNTWT